MRCPSCGTENEPDSRFCGGCGARLGEARLAPTQKIDTGAQPVQQPPMQAAAHPVSVRTPSVSPESRARPISGAQNVPPASFPLTPSVQRNPSKPQAVAQPMATPQHGTQMQNGAPGTAARSMPRPSQRRAAEDSLAPPPKRRLGLIITVLLVDLALAGAGTYLLVEGLASPSSETSAKSSASGAALPAGGSSAVVAPKPVVTPLPSDTATAIANAPPPDAAAPDAPAAAAAKPPTPAQPKPQAKSPKPATPSRAKAQPSKSTQPVDPYNEGPSDPFPPDLPPPPPPPRNP